MKSELNITQFAGVQLVKAVNLPNTSATTDLKPKGRYVVEHWRNGKRFNEYHFANDIVNEGKNSILDIMFHAATQIGTWYMGIIDDLNYTALAATDTYDDINQAANGWDEFVNYTTGGSGVLRPTWEEDAASGQSITNSTVAVFDITGTGTAKGLFLCGGTASCNTKGDHDPNGTMWATALFGSGDVAVQSGDQLKTTYTVST